MDVLVIDDDPVSAQLAAALVEDLGFGVIRADGAEPGLRLLEESGASIALVDWEMPGTSGIEFCRRVRRRFTSRYVYLIVVSGHYGRDALTEAMESGADDYISKPLRPHELGVRIGTAYRVVALERELASKNRRLAQAYDQLMAELARTTADLDAASRLQQKRLPRSGRFGEVGACGFLRPATYNAGDVYDYFELTEDLFCFYVADVVGHGTTAAMTSHSVRHLMRAGEDGLCHRNLERTGSPDEMVLRTMEDLNRHFYIDEDDNQWFTMILGVVDQRTGVVTVCQGGHPPAIRVARADGSTERVGRAGFSVAMFERARFELDRRTLDPGDRLAVYSDGLLEGLSDRGDAAATEIVERELVRSLELPFDELASQVSGRVFSLGAGDGAADDVTLVVLEYRPTEARSASLDIACELGELERVERAVESLLEGSGASSARAGAIALALSEAVCNVIRHGGAECSIRVDMTCSADRLRADILDRGPGMPEAVRRRVAAREVALPAVSGGDVEGLPVSGMGLGIILSTVTDVDYVAGVDGNRLILSFEL